MIREIVAPTGNTLTLELPGSFVGKEIEVLAFELTSAGPTPVKGPDNSAFEQRLTALKQLAAKYPIDLNNFKFDRHKANNYDE